MTEEKEQRRELLSYIRERDEAREELKKIKEELSATKSKLYDANCDVEELEQALASANKKIAAAAASGKNSPAPAGKGAPAKKGGKGNNLKAPAKASPATSSTNVKDDGKKSPAPAATPATAPSKGHRHPPIEGKLYLSEDTILYYTEIAKEFSNLKLGQVLDAEKKFNMADENGDGVIDKDELSKVLTQHSDIALFTPTQVQGIMTEIDKDDTGTLDFFEVLAILDKYTRRKAAKPELQTIQKHQADVCAIQ